MKVLVTGGTGFQGSHLVDFLLKEKHKVTILNTLSEASIMNSEKFKDKASIVWGSVTDKELVIKTVREHNLIVHLAARINVDESISEPLAYLETNVIGTYNILEALRNFTGSRPRLIYWSSCEVYGQPNHEEKLSETTELRPQSPYAASKAAADRLCYSYYKTYNLNVTVVRFFNVFGERQKSGLRGALIPILVEKALKKELLVVSGSGKQTRDYLHVADVVNAFKLLVNTPNLSGETINFASGTNTSVIDIVNYIAKKFKVKVEHGASRPGEVMMFPANIAKARAIGFRPSVSIWEGIDRYIAWRLEH